MNVVIFYRDGVWWCQRKRMWLADTREEMIEYLERSTK